MPQHQGCLDAIEEGIIFGGYVGVLKATKLFNELILSSTSRGLVHVFFSKRATSKVVNKYIDEGIAKLVPKVLFIDESTAAYKAAVWLASATPPPAHVISRGIGWQGIDLLLDGLFGTGTGSTVSVENVGLLGSTRVGSRRVIQISAGFMIFFSMLALFASIPFIIFAAVYCLLFGFVAAVGLSFLQFTNINSMHNLFIVGVSIFLGLSITQYFFNYSTTDSHGPAHIC
ncbi:nucleobase-ascorbate transporter 2-like isoform X2 [Asparagus officinalis]|uniref:nucleobase-ascorbate transporter 2-like isoform X2 n=1 Tax=Asparagus officinalis TaxID=4686 RepID=UPI00098E4DAA|nr:nucleobase-ascorbate transporter 2-like isoform X2 [Asparagus officinalis]